MVKITANDGTDILSRLWNNVIKNGLVNRRLDSSRLGLLLSAIATEMNVVSSVLESYMSQFNLNTCTDRIMIENMSRMFAVRRLASKSKAIVVFSRINGFTESVKIPAGFAIKSSADQNIVFKTISDVYLWKGSEQVSVLAYSIKSGRKYNVPKNTLTTYQANNYNTLIAVTNPEDAFGGYNDESIEHLRTRSKGFRYERDGTWGDIRRQMFMLGVKNNQWYGYEYSDGYGSYLLCIDTNSAEEFEDLKSKLAYKKVAGIKQIFVRATRISINIYISLETTGDKDYTPLQKENIYNAVETTVQKFFAANCWVGHDLKIDKMRSDLNQALSSFNIASMFIDFDTPIAINKRKNTIPATNTQKLVPNKILTNLNYRGD